MNNVKIVSFTHRLNAMSIKSLVSFFGEKIEKANQNDICKNI